MISSALIVAGVCATAGTHASSSDEALLTSGVWMHLDSKWEKAPPEAEVNESTAYARLVRFLPNGEFSWIACIVRRAGHRTMISAGDGQVIFIGRWRRTNDGIAVQYVKVYEMVHAVDDSDAPFSKVSKGAVHLAGDELTFDGRKYRRTGAPATKEYDSEYIAPERQQHRERLRSYFPQ